MPALPASAEAALREEAGYPDEVVMLRRPAAADFVGIAAGRRGSSEDDLPLRLNHAQDRGVGRGLNPAPDEHGPAASWSMTEGFRRLHYAAKSGLGETLELA
jgi:hypothetical protein